MRKDRMSQSLRKELIFMIVKIVIMLTAIGLLIAVSPYFAFIFLALFIWIVADVLIGVVKKPRPVAPEGEPDCVEDRYDYSDMLWLFEHPGKTNPEIDFSIEDIREDVLLATIQSDCRYINSRFDCLDFRATRLYRFATAADPYLDAISPSGKVRELIDETFLGMKFWITEKGHDSVCYFSENHEITFFVLAYLLGRRYPDRVFLNDGRTGKEKAEEARSRMLIWLDLRGKYGFSEFYSHNYLPIDFAQLSLLLLHGDREDRLLMTKAKAVLDILCLDYAHAYKNGTIIGAQGRAYARNNINCAFAENNSDILMDAIWNEGKGFGGENCHAGRQAALFLLLLNTKDEKGEPLYQVPQAIKNIGTDDGVRVIKTSFGLNLADIEKEGLLGLSDRQIMFQFGMEAFSNPEVINNTFDMVNEYSLLKNEFFSYFKFFNVSLLRFLGIFPFVSKLGKIYPNGVSIERSNVYAYKTPAYKLSTLVDYKPGSSGAQQTTMAAVLPEGVTVFTHHPLKDDSYNTSPGFWGGYGVAPHAAQFENVSVLIHKIPKSILFSPSSMLPYTHTFFSEELLDEVKVEGRYAFARKGSALIALIGTSDFEYLDFNADKTRIMEGLLKDPTKRFELVQRGKVQATVYELSTIEKEGSLSSFAERIRANKISFNGNELTYQSEGKTISLTYGGSFVVNGETQETEYKRYDSDFVQTDYLTGDISVSAGGASCHINVLEGIRQVN